METEIRARQLTLALVGQQPFEEEVEEEQPCSKTVVLPSCLPFLGLPSSPSSWRA
jgi:hypothetical protein